MPYLTRLLRGLTPIACGAMVACGGGNDDALFRGGGSGGSSSETADGGLGINLSTVGDSSLGLNVDGAPPGLVGSTSLDDAACAKETRKGEQLPLDMYIMLDRSPSMTDLTSDMKTTKWDAVKAAITAFLNDPSSAGLGVGLQFFPLNQPNVPATCTTQQQCGQFGPCANPNVCSDPQNLTFCDPTHPCQRPYRCVELGTCFDGLCNFVGQDCAPPVGSKLQPQACTAWNVCANRDACTLASYVTPAVEVAPLPGVAATITTAITQHNPDNPSLSGTPTAMAMNGALTHAAALATAKSTHRVVVVLATDGLPTWQCEASAQTPAMLVQKVAGLAATAVAAKPSIPTFVIGVFAPDEAVMAQSNLDSIATAGGTSKSFIVNTGQNVTMAFLAALNAIRTTALACEYNVPQPEAGQLDFGAVNVKFTLGNGQVTTVPYSGGNAAACTAKGGWYYDVDPASGGTPTKIEMCPVSCTTIKAETSGQVNILLGCKTESIVR